MTLHRFTIFRLSRSLLVLLVSLHVIACGSGASSGDSEQSLSSIVNLNWIAPSEREDGVPISLSEIAGYRIYYGSSAGEYPNRLEILDGTALEASLGNIIPGQYYFVITTLDTDGRESAFSDEVSIYISR